MGRLMRVINPCFFKNLVVNEREKTGTPGAKFRLGLLKKTSLALIFNMNICYVALK